MEHIESMIRNLAKTRESAIADLQKLKDAGTKIVGAYCLFAPTELITAAGAVPVSLCGMTNEPIAHAEKHMPRNLCPLIKSSYGYAVTGTCPYFYYSDLIVGETTCDGKKKMFELLTKIAPVHVMRLPQSNDRQEDMQAWKQEIIRLKNRIEQDFGLTITDEALRQAIKEKNEERRVYRDMYSLSKHIPPLLHGSQVHHVLHGSGYAFDKAAQLAKVRALIDEVKNMADRGKIIMPAGRPRILITGCPVGGATEKIISIIEESGGEIVCFENCGGAKDREFLVDKTIDPYDALTRKYINLACSCMSPNNARIELLSRLIDEYRAQGVIDVVLHACHTYNVETWRVKELAQKNKGIAYLHLETDYSPGDEGQLRTRISAFVEMLS
ncbi:MAG: 2-hydroxyacyl-CoA dehydratase [Deltaproteobacteria bacterium]|nr:2-hydroxyacyl-CoA dehydratase [Deltaproteobacteria bacterium]